MTNNNSKHTIAVRTTAISQKIFLSFGFINEVSGVSAIISHETTRSSKRLFVDVQFFRYSLTLQSLSHSQAHILGYEA